MIFNSENPLFFIFDCVKAFVNLLLDPRFAFWDIPLLIWSLGFIVISMIISVFWRGARG